MKKLTYGLVQDSAYLKKVDANGEFIRQEKSRYLVNVARDLIRPISPLEKAMFQQGPNSSSKVVSEDEDRGLFAQQRGDASHDNPFYIATMCIIGSLMDTPSARDQLPIEYIVKAVETKNDDWKAAIDRYNQLFDDVSDGSSFKLSAIYHVKGRVAIAYMLTGLQIICDVVKQLFTLTDSGRYIEATEIANSLNRMCIERLDTYRLLNSPEHPEHQDLIERLHNYEARYELCLSESNEWLLVNKYKLKKIVGQADLHHIAVEQGNTQQELRHYEQEAAEPREAQINVAEQDGFVESHQPKHKDAPQPTTHSVIEPADENKVSSSAGDELEQQERELEQQERVVMTEDKPTSPQVSYEHEELDVDSSEAPQAEVLQGAQEATKEHESESGDYESSGETVEQAQKYQTTRKKRVPTRLANQAVAGGSLFKAPKNVGAVPIQVDDI